MRKIILDVKDKKILYELEKNCRQPLSVIAKNVGLSREVVSYRINQLEKNKVIEYYVTVVDYVKMGYVFCRAWFKYHNVSQEIEEKMIDFARKIKSINWILIGDGLFNMVVVFLVKDINSLDKEFDKFRYAFGKHIGTITPSIAFQIYHFKNSYLYDNDDRVPVIVGGSLAEETDHVDMQIIGELVKKPKINLIDLSRKVNITAKTASKKISELQKRGLIKQSKAKINTHLLGYEHQKVLLYMSNLTGISMNEIIMFLRYDHRIIFITKPFGNADLEFEIIVKSKRELFEFMRKLISKFPDNIKDYDVCLTYSEPFTRYLTTS